MRSLSRRSVVGAAAVLVVGLATAAPAVADDGHHHHARYPSRSYTLLNADLVTR